MAFPVPVSVLELAPVGDGASPASALRDSIERAEVADDLGFHRFWVAEHHNMPGIASSSPPVLLAAVAAATSSIRVGSGGVMLPNHAALAVAEQFGMLEALHPGRVDLGLGRAPGTDPLTARALRRSTGPATADDFPAQLVELFGFFSGEMGDDHPYRHITAVPALGHEPEIWLLGSSGYSAEAAGYLGLPFSFAHHFSAANTLPALARYREVFRPSTRLEAPHAMVAVGVVCAETEDEARWLAGPSALSFLRLRSGRPGPLPTPEEAAAHPYTPMEREMIRSWTASRIIGDPAQVRAGLEELLDRTGADEVMITTMLHGHEGTVRSHRLVAETLGIPERRPADALV
jgi:luciferase family oxidoreductase group 1